MATPTSPKPKGPPWALSRPGRDFCPQSVPTGLLRTSVAGSAASSPLQAQMLRPQVPAFAESETAAPAGAGTGCCRTGTPGDGDTSASRMTTRSGLSITARSLPAAGKYPGGYQRLLSPRQAASPASCFVPAGGKGTRGARQDARQALFFALYTPCSFFQLHPEG